MMIPLLIFLLSLGRFAGASDIDYDIQGNLYVADRLGNAIVKYSPAGDSIRAVSGFGSGNEQFDTPVALCARRGNDIYVADYNNHRIQRFNRTLDYITTIYTRDNQDERKRFGYPRDIAISRQGDLLVVDGENRRIVRINASGQGVGAFGDINAGAGRLLDPSSIEVDDEDNIYVLDRGRIVEFDPFGSFMREIPHRPASRDIAISIDRDTLTVIDSVEADLYDLKTLSFAGIYRLAAPAAVLRLTGGRMVAVEGRRVAIYAKGDGR
ncbi:MAG: hypothetical protein JWQ98_175 [Chlorobi bacterium]|nr:hypothetical protein [Chlorobiota bacterium]